MKLSLQMMTSTNPRTRGLKIDQLRRAFSRGHKLEVRLPQDSRFLNPMGRTQLRVPRNLFSVRSL
jgi:hypothetical protein